MKFKKTINFIAVLCLSLQLVYAQVPVTSNKPAVSQSSNRAFLKLDSFLVAANTNQWAAGSTAIVLQNGKTVYSKAFGFKDREAKEKMEVSDIFRIASMTKAVVTAAAMILVEQGKLSLDDNLSQYVPEFKDTQVLKTFNEKDSTYTTVPARSEITIRQLMTHTSGIGYGFADPRMAIIYSKNNIPDLATAENVTIAEKMKQLGTLPLGVHPGESFYYGLGIDVLGYVIEVASGEPLDRFVARTILKPLNMDDTYFFIPGSKKDRLVVMYGQNKEGQLFRLPEKNGRNTVNFPISGAKTYFSGGSGLSSTTADYARFLQMILDKGSFNGKQVLQAESVEQMTINQIGAINVGEGANKFSLGFEISAEDDASKGIKAGKLRWGGAFNTTFWIDPQRKSIAILMTQVYPAPNQEKLYAGFETLVNQGLDAR